MYVDQLNSAGECELRGGTYYLRADLDEELSSTLARELLLAPELEQSRGSLNMRSPVTVTVPGIEVYCLHTVQPHAQLLQK